jgi:hypothetical protein
MSDQGTLYKEVDYTHPLSWRMNDAKPPTSLALISETEPKSLRSTKGIKVSTGKRNDEKWVLSFDLTEEGHVGNFAAFCKDMIDSTRHADPKIGTELVAVQYLKWKDMFMTARDPLDKARIQGLIGELLFLRDTISLRYGLDTAIHSWTGPLGMKQDFQCPDMWYEVKTISDGKKAAQVTSLDQLDRDDTGRFVVVKVRDSAGTSAARFTVNMVYEDIMDRLSPLYQCYFHVALENIGFRCSEDYDRYGFELVSITEYEVREGFPRLCRSKVETGVSEAVYEINLDVICDFMVR